MGLFKKKADPISDRARTLNAEIAALESKIKKLNEKSAQKSATPKAGSIPTLTPSPPQPPAPKAPSGGVKRGDPIFEAVDHGPLKAPPEAAPPRAQFNELGIRKYDLAAFLRRLKGDFQSKPASNPKLVSYLAAGSIQGLRPLRYEKRVARNRFIVLTILFILVLWGVIAVFLKRH